MREIAIAREMHEAGLEDMEFIYMGRCLTLDCLLISNDLKGYYIQSCQKMRYKGEFVPSELLDPVSDLDIGLQEADA